MLLSWWISLLAEVIYTHDERCRMLISSERCWRVTLCQEFLFFLNHSNTVNLHISALLKGLVAVQESNLPRIRQSMAIVCFDSSNLSKTLSGFSVWNKSVTQCLLRSNLLTGDGSSNIKVTASASVIFTSGLRYFWFCSNSRMYMYFSRCYTGLNEPLTSMVCVFPEDVCP